MKPSLLTVARRAMTGETKIPRGATVLVAVSGGPDSMALFDVLARLGPKVGFRVVGHGVDHGLRESARGELDLAASHAKHLDVAFDRTRVRVARGGNLQARAREARFAALTKAAERCGACAVATAHHADDRAETLLMRLLRGAGLRGLAVLPSRARIDEKEDRELLRPLLRARRSDVVLHLERHEIPFARDPSNDDPRFLRTRIRTEVLPMLERIDPRVVSHLEALADELVTTREASEGPRDTAFPLSRATETALRALVRSRAKSARIWLPGGLVAAVAEGPRRARPPSQKR